MASFELVQRSDDDPDAERGALNPSVSRVAPLMQSGGGGSSSLVPQSGGSPAGLKASTAQFRATFKATKKSSPRDCCKKGDKGCCQHLCNICCFPCSYYPRCSAATAFAAVVTIFVLGSLALTWLLDLDTTLQRAADRLERSQPPASPDANFTRTVEDRDDMRRYFEYILPVFDPPPAAQWDGCVEGVDGDCVESWYPCELTTEYSTGRRAECAMIPMPLLYTPQGTDASHGETIDVFVKRYLAYGMVSSYAPRTRKALWVLQGGPGDSSVNMEWLMSTMGIHMDVYTMDHRGVGRSSPMTCTAAQSLTEGSTAGTTLALEEVRRCFAAFDAQFQTPNAHRGFSVTGAAHDLRRAIGMLNRDQQTSVYGVSYGTMITSRYMMVSHEISPDGPPQAISVILDGVVSTSGGEHQYGRLSFRDWGVNFERVGKDFFTACGADEFCSGYLGTGDAPYEMVVNLHKKLREGHCRQIPVYGASDHSEMLKVVSNIMLSDKTQRVLLPALIYRLNRCNEGDIAFVLSVMIKFFGYSPLNMLSPDAPVDPNKLLYYNIKFSELYIDDPLADPWGDEEEIKRQHAGNHFAHSGLDDWRLSLVFAGFPSATHPIAYPRDGFYDSFPETRSDVLVMNGMLDPQTPYQYGHVQYEGLVQHGSSHKWLADFPGLAHGVATRSDCAFNTMLEFLHDPAVDPVLAANCVEDMSPINFGQDPVLCNPHDVICQAVNMIVSGVGSSQDLFDGVSTFAETVAIANTAVQAMWWSLFGCCVLPCCVLFMCVVDLRMDTLGHVCCW